MGRWRRYAGPPALALLRLALAKGPLRRRGNGWSLGSRVFSARTVKAALEAGDAVIVGDRLMAPEAQRQAFREAAE